MKVANNLTGGGCRVKALFTSFMLYHIFTQHNFHLKIVHTVHTCTSDSLHSCTYAAHRSTCRCHQLLVPSRSDGSSEMLSTCSPGFADRPYHSDWRKNSQDKFKRIFYLYLSTIQLELLLDFTLHSCPILE